MSPLPQPLHWKLLVKWGASFAVVIVRSSPVRFPNWHDLPSGLGNLTRSSPIQLNGKLRINQSEKSGYEKSCQHRFHKCPGKLKGWSSPWEILHVNVIDFYHRHNIWSVRRLYRVRHEYCQTRTTPFTGALHDGTPAARPLVLLSCHEGCAVFQSVEH